MEAAHIRKVSILFGIGAVLVSCLSCDCSPSSADGTSDHGFTARDPFALEFDATSLTRLRLSGINGGVTFTGVDGARAITISGERRVQSYSQSDAEASLERLEVRVDETGSELSVETVQPPEPDGRTYVVDFDITLPKDVEVAVNHVNGNIVLGGLFGNSLVNLVNGEIGGNVRLPDDGIVDWSTVNGTITLDIPTDTSAVFSAGVVNGTITVSNLPLRQSDSSKTSLQGTLGSGRGLIQLGAVNGRIEVRGN